MKNWGRVLEVVQGRAFEAWLGHLRKACVSWHWQCFELCDYSKMESFLICEVMPASLANSADNLSQCSITHLLTTHALAHSLTHSLAHPPITHPPTNLQNQRSILTHTPTQEPAHSSAYSSTCKINNLATFETPVMNY